MLKLKVRRSYQRKVALVTGAAGGLGRALCLNLADRGASVGLMDLNEPGLDELAEAMRERGARTLVLAGDITDEATCHASVRRTIDELGGLDLLVNNAGLVQRSAFEETQAAVFRKVMDVNFYGSLYCTQAAIEQLKRARGQIITVSSIAGFAPLYGRTGYSASKHALHGLFDSLRAEMLEHKVAVLVACPGFIDTDFSNNALDADGSVTDHPQSTVGGKATPAQVASAIMEAASREKDILVLSRTGHITRLVNTLSQPLYTRLMVRSLKHELDR